MSLDDKFYPDDGTLLTRFDNCMIYAAGKIGEAYQQLTGRSYKDLYDKSMDAATLFMIASAATADSIVAAAPAIWYTPAYVIDRLDPEFETPLEERIKDESSAYRTTAGRASRAMCFSGGIAIAALGTLFIVEPPQDKEKAATIRDGLNSLFLGAGLLAGTFAQYLSKSQPPEPPEKHVFARGWDKMKEYLTPAPMPVPAPIPAGYAIAHDTLRTT